MLEFAGAYLFLLIFLSIPVVLYNKMYKGRFYVILWYSYIMSLAFIFFRHYFTGKTPRGFDLIIYLVVGWLVSFLILGFFISICEFAKEHGRKEYEKEKSDYYYLKDKEDMTNQEKKRFSYLVKHKSIYEDDNYNFDEVWKNR